MKTLYSVKETRSKRDPPPTWRRAETFIADEYNLREDHGAWYDARSERDTPIEIKSCAYEYKDGRLGRFAIWESQLEQLLARGRVALLVYGPRTTRNIIATELVLPGELRNVGSVSRVKHPSMGYRRIRRIPWVDAVSLDAITFGLRHHFADHYNEAEIEETTFMHPTKINGE